MVRLKVGGMTCEHCVRAVTEAVRSVVPGADVTVSLATGEVGIASGHDIPVERVAAAIEEEGYEVRRG